MYKNEWGNITWKFFHTFAECIEDNLFPKIKDKAIDIIICICNNLPCPICQEHATITIQKAYIKKIQTKKHFKEFLRQFHNIVNIKLDKKTYSRSEVENMYKNINIYNVINKFIYIFNKKEFNVKLMTNNLHKSIFIKSFISKINSIQYALKIPSTVKSL